MSSVLILGKDAKRRGVQIVVLAAPNGAGEGVDRQSGQADGQREDDEDHFHAEVPKVRERSAMARTVSELAGMTMAAMMGLMTPRTAQEPATTL